MFPLRRQATSQTLANPSEFYLPETQPPELPRQPSSDSPTGSTQPWSDSPAVPQPPSSPHSPPSIADTREGLVPKRRLGIADEDAGFLRGTRTPRIPSWDEHAWISSWDEDRGLKCGGGSDTSQAHRRVCSNGKVLSAFFLD
ncbi:unnamed protein product [Dicrocoelium dendriticum]|nr:unnamed protein product [Dicrocoelium dendriticum]